MEKEKRVNAILAREYTKLYVKIYDVDDPRFKDEYDEYRKIYQRKDLIRACGLKIDEVESMQKFFDENQEKSTKYRFLSDFFYIRIFDEISKKRGLGGIKI